MKKVLLLIVLLFTTIFYSQINSGEVTYGLTISYDEKLSEDERFGAIFEKAQIGAKKISFTLFFNNDVSLFKVNEMITDKDIAFAKAFTGGNNIYFTEINTEKKVKEINSSGYGKFIINYTKKSDWVLLNETKYIDSYLCYKATTETTIVNSKGTFKFPVTAWYCPSIPFNYGPYGYDGLPGLILELNERYTTYGALKINLSKENSTIEKPNKGKIVTQEEFNEIIKTTPTF